MSDAISAIFRSLLGPSDCEPSHPEVRYFMLEARAEAAARQAQRTAKHSDFHDRGRLLNRLKQMAGANPCADPPKREMSLDEPDRGSGG